MQTLAKEELGTEEGSLEKNELQRDVKVYFLV